MNKIIKMILLMTIQIMVISSCSEGRTISKELTSVIQDDRCAPPCWYGITPGSTTKDEAKELLKIIPFVDIDSIQEVSDMETDDSIRWTATTKASIFGRLYFKNNVVSIIDIYYSQKYLEFRELIQNLGLPENILVVHIMGSGERDTMVVEILYPTRGYGFRDYFSVLSPRNPILVSPESNVQHIWYCEPEKFFLFLKSGPIGEYPDTIIDQGLQEWKGFGSYQFINFDLFNSVLSDESIER